MAEREYGIKFTGQTEGLNRSIFQVQRNITGLTRGLKTGLSTLNPFRLATALMGGTFALVAKSVGEFEDKMTRMGIETGASLDQMLGFKNQLLDTSIATGVGVDQLTALSGAAMKTTHDFKFVNSELDIMAQLQQATGMSGQELGTILGNLHVRTGLVGKDFDELLKTLYAFGQTRGVKMNFEAIAPQIESSATLAKAIYGKDATLAQIGDIAMTKMMLGPKVNFDRAFIRALSKAGGPTSQFLAPLGINFSKELAKGTKVSDIILKILHAIHGLPAEKTRELGKLFGLKAGIGFEELEKTAEVMKRVDKNKLGKDAAAEALTYDSAMKTLHATLLKVADTELAKPLSDFSKWIREISSDGSLHRWIDDMKNDLAGVKGVLDMVLEGYRDIYEFTHDAEADDIRKREQQKKKKLEEVSRDRELGKITYDEYRRRTALINQIQMGSVDKIPYAPPGTEPFPDFSKSWSGVTPGTTQTQTSVMWDISDAAKKILEPRVVTTTTAPTGNQQWIGTPDYLRRP